jgi:hypothetical protein
MAGLMLFISGFGLPWRKRLILLLYHFSIYKGEFDMKLADKIDTKLVEFSPWEKDEDIL